MAYLFDLEAVRKQTLYKRRRYTLYRARLRTALLDDRPLDMLLEISKALIRRTLVLGQPLSVGTRGMVQVFCNLWALFGRSASTPYGTRASMMRYDCCNVYGGLLLSVCAGKNSTS